jgi:hypothetical protein
MSKKSPKLVTTGALMAIQEKAKVWRMELCNFIEYLEVPLMYLRKFFLILVRFDIVLYMHDLVIFQLVYVLQ